MNELDFFVLRHLFIKTFLIFVKHYGSSSLSCFLSVLLPCLFLLPSTFHVYNSNSFQSFSRSRKSLTRHVRAVIDLISVFPRAAPNCETSVRRWKVTQALPRLVNFNIHGTRLVRISNTLAEIAPYVCLFRESFRDRYHHPLEADLQQLASVCWEKQSKLSRGQELA